MFRSGHSVKNCSFLSRGNHYKEVVKPAQVRWLASCVVLSLNRDGNLSHLHSTNQRTQRRQKPTLCNRVFLFFVRTYNKRLEENLLCPRFKILSPKVRPSPEILREDGEGGGPVSEGTAICNSSGVRSGQLHFLIFSLLSHFLAAIFLKRFSSL